ncbi:hypothetical protein [Urechidicola vernalis]|uniref:Uncharacterized protein n=1 Tax=Urechidicola vernalis TaxID=3075600 RepID=A0ABU2Y1Y7_9FLAO|nr:hypothetical protein [Urechidicola sp. P050]MDT0552042.1 hypothetical protein [Urechidicola sp. P050]
MEEAILELIPYSAPALVTGLVAYYFFNDYLKSENRKQKIELIRDKKKEILPIRLQAYERMTLFMERINPSKLLVRVTPTDENKELYTQKLLLSIEQEFEHNLAQQIYISEACWNALIAAKNATRNLVMSSSNKTEVKSAQDLRETILKTMVDSSAPSNTGIAFIKEEVKELY